MKAAETASEYRIAAVSMESGLEDRNNLSTPFGIKSVGFVSMESGLEDRNSPWPYGLAPAGGNSSQWSPA